MTSWHARPVFHVADVHASLDFYCTRLGFTEGWRFDEGTKRFVAQVERDGCAIIFTSQWPDRHGKGMLLISLGDGSLATIDAVRADLEARGAPVKDDRWGDRLFTVDDPDGNKLFFSYPDE